MVLLVNQSAPHNPRRFLVKGSWSLSWRSSKKNLLANEEVEDKRFQRKPERRWKHVMFNDDHIATEIPAEDNLITRDEIESLWYRVSTFKIL
jgi:hypothetical protein